MSLIPKHIPILMYHQVLPKSNPHFGKHIAAEPETLREHIKYLLEQGYTIKTVREFFDHPAPFTQKKCAMLTFDDVSSSFIEHAKPVFDEFGVKASIFPIKNMTMNLKWHNLSPDGIRGLTEQELKQLHDEGFELGSHCLSHQNLHKIKFVEAKAEMKESKEWLESITGVEIVTICYPIGGIDKDIVETAQELGYKNGLTTYKCSLQLDSDRMVLRRVDIKNFIRGKKFEKAVGRFYGMRRFLTRPFRAKYRVDFRHPDLTK